MNISVSLGEDRELFAEIKEGELIGIKEPTIPDINEYPDACLRFMQLIVDAIKTFHEE